MSARLPPSPWKTAKQRSIPISASIARPASTSVRLRQSRWNEETYSLIPPTLQIFLSMIHVGVLGATGAVGQRFVQLLADHPWFHLQTLTASERSAGKPYGKVVNWRLDAPYPDNVSDIVVTPTTVESLKDCDLVFSALPADVAGPFETELANAGIAVCSNARSHRMEPDVPRSRWRSIRPRWSGLTSSGTAVMGGSS